MRVRAKRLPPKPGNLFTKKSSISAKENTELVPAIAIGLSKARRAGVELPPPEKGKASEETRRQAARALAKGQKSAAKSPSRTRSRATLTALQHEGKEAASHTAVSRQASASARKRGPADRSRAAQKAVRTKGKAGLTSAARKAARTRAAGG